MIKKLAFTLLFKSCKDSIEVDDITKFMGIFGDKYSNSVRRRDNKGVLLTNSEIENSFKIEIDKISVVEQGFTLESIDKFCDELSKVMEIVGVEGLDKLSINVDANINSESDPNDVIESNVINASFMEKLNSRFDVLAMGIRTVINDEFGVCDMRIEPLFKEEKNFYIGMSIINDENVNIESIKATLNHLFDQIKITLDLIKGV